MAAAEQTVAKSGILERFLSEEARKADEVLVGYAAGRPLQVDGDGWLVRFAAHIAGGSDKDAAASAMLAALHAAIPFIDTTGPLGAIAFNRVSRAIAQAESAGVKAEG